MGYKVNFMDSELVTASYLNDTAAELGGGVGSFSDDMTYGVDDLNAISQTLITKGVSRGCSLSVSGSNVTIGEGVAFMADGRRVEVDSGGVVLSYTADTVNYVWLYFDEVTGFVAPRCTTDEPTGSYVFLGRITADGTVEGRADVARMKNTFLGTNKTETVTKSGFSWAYSNGMAETLLWEVALDVSGYRTVVASSSGNLTSDGYRKNAFCGYVDLETSAAWSVLETLDSHGTCALDFSDTNGRILAGYTTNRNIMYYVYLRFALGSDNVLRVYRSAEEADSFGSLSMPAVNVTIRLC